MSTTTTTEPLNLPITAQDKRALRHADSIVFRLYKGQATIEASRDGARTSSGFDEQHTIYVGGPNVGDHERESTGLSWDEQLRRYSGFHMEHHGVRYTSEIRTLVERLKIGGKVELHWTRNNNSELTRKLNLVRDELRIHIFALAKVQPDSDDRPKPDVYLIDVSVGYDNSARMIKIDWNAS